MPLTLPLPNTSAANHNPAPSKKPPRPKLRGFSILHSHAQSSSQPASLLNAVSTPIRNGRVTAAADTLLNPSSQQTPNSIASFGEHNIGEAEQQPYFSRPQSAVLPTPPRPLTFEEAYRAMARNRAGSAPHGANAVRTPSENSSSGLTGHPHDQIPTIRFIPHQDPRSNRPSLAFPATARTLPHEDCVIRVGRYSERDTNPNPPPNTPSSAPVGFKSKVVSRRHCEFWCSQGQWYIKDVKSSSGTFLNHIRLSQPSVESKPFPVHDGDVVQLGIDFRGGEEMIFRCVKIRVECNRAWQKTFNSYNVTTHKRLRDLSRSARKDSDTASSHSSECSICLMSIAPCQSLFVAPCSHVWHYKCIRPILNDHKSWPQFLCPNCRAVTDLEADVDDVPDGEWEDENATGSSPEIPATQQSNGSIAEEEGYALEGIDEDLPNAVLMRLNIKNDTHLTTTMTSSSDPTNDQSASPNLLTRRNARRVSPPFPLREPSATRSTSSQVQYLRPVTPTQPLMGNGNIMDESSLRTPTATDMLLHDGPMTPTNNAGPFVFDGSAGRVAGHRIAASLLDCADSAPSDA